MFADRARIFIRAGKGGDGRDYSSDSPFSSISLFWMLPQKSICEKDLMVVMMSMVRPVIKSAPKITRGNAGGIDMMSPAWMASQAF